MSYKAEAASHGMPNWFLLLSAPPVDWKEAVDAIPMVDRQEYERYLSAASVQAARLCGYLMQRGVAGCGDNGHNSGVDESNRYAKRVRKALGYTLPKDNIRF